MTRTGALLVFTAVWLVCLVALAPMRWLGELDVWRDAGLSASGASGTIWNGRLLGVASGPRQWGDVRAGLSAGSLLGGTAAIALKADGASGELLLGRQRGLRAASGDFPLALRTTEGPVSLLLSLDAVSAVFRAERCFEAEGRVDAVVTLAAAGAQAPQLALSGSPTCREDVVEVNLVPSAGSPAIALLVQAKADGNYRLHWTARAPDAALSAALGLAGFTTSADGMARIDQGRIGDADVDQE